MLLTKEIIAQLPALYAQDGKGDESIAYVKFFTPDSNWTWYATEYSAEEELFFGLVVGFDTELGYFALEELEESRGPLSLPIERDLHFKPTTLKEIRGTL